MAESCMIAKVITDGEICRADFFIRFLWRASDREAAAGVHQCGI